MATLNGARRWVWLTKPAHWSRASPADVIAVDLGELETELVAIPLSQLVYAVSRRQAMSAAGQWVLAERHLRTLDLDENSSARRGTGGTGSRPDRIWIKAHLTGTIRRRPRPPISTTCRKSPNLRNSPAVGGTRTAN